MSFARDGSTTGNWSERCLFGALLEEVETSGDFPHAVALVRLQGDEARLGQLLFLFLFWPGQPVSNHGHGTW